MSERTNFKANIKTNVFTFSKSTPNKGYKEVDLSKHVKAVIY